MSFSCVPATITFLFLAAAPFQDEAPPSRALLFEFAAQPRLAGTIGSQVGADIVKRHLEDAGFAVEIDEREVLLSLPRRIEFEIFDASAPEKVAHRRNERFDPDAIPPGDLPMCNAWSASGEVRAQVVDVGQGLRADFERLKQNGVAVTGKIALARYGGAYRGIKVDLATQYGCVGVLLFHERNADGEAWPKGPWKPGFEGERGSISPMGRTPGDPSTPGWASPQPGKKSRRLAAPELADALPTIPCIPIGWAEAEIIRARLTPREMIGPDGKATTKPLGPGPLEVRLLVDQPRDVRKIQNVIATLPGASTDCVIAGNHRDAWVRGAHDAGSGTVSMLRAAQHLGARAKTGWKPKHTIKLCFWDAEEFGLIGSTEWGEANGDWIEKHVIAYVNADAAVTGTHFRGVSGTPGLLATLQAALARVPMPAPLAPDAPQTMLEDWQAALKGREAQISLAGSGSDFAVFLHHLSVPTLDIGLGGNRGGQYHTAFDDFAMVERYLDPGFAGHELCGQFLFELLTELTERGRGSFDAIEAARTLSRVASAAGVEKDGSPSWLGPERALRIATAFDTIAERDTGAPPLANFYRSLAFREGIPGREWYRNPIWTPGLEDGYGSETFPILHQQALIGTKELDAAVERLVLRIAGIAEPTSKTDVQAPK